MIADMFIAHPFYFIWGSWALVHGIAAVARAVRGTPEPKVEIEAGDK